MRNLFAEAHFVLLLWKNQYKKALKNLRSPSPGPLRGSRLFKKETVLRGWQDSLLYMFYASSHFL